MDELDALLELADAVCDDPNDAEHAAAPAKPRAAQPLAEQEEEDLLLCLADTFAAVGRASAAAAYKPGPGKQQQQLLSHTPTQASGSRRQPGRTPPAAPAPLNTGGTAKRGASAAAGTVTMYQTKAFTAVGGSSRVLGSSSSSGPAHLHSSSSGSGSSAKQAQAKKQHLEPQHYVEKLTNIKIKLPRVSGIVLRERYKHITYVPVSKAKDHVAPDGSSWVVVGVLVSKSFGTTTAGAPYSRWRISDLAGSDTWVGLFGEAHKDHYAEAEGSVLAFYQPRFASKGPSSSSSTGGLAVSQSSQIELLATSAGWGICKGKTKTGTRCNNAVDTTVSHFCQYHALQQAKTLRVPAAAAVANKGRQQGQAATAAAGGGGGAAGPVAAAPSNGKVFDARKNSWSSSIPSSTQQQQQRQQNIGSSGSSRPKFDSSGSGSASFGAAANTGIGNGQPSAAWTQQLKGPLGDAAAAAACSQRAAACEMERQRREKQHQAELRETLRRQLKQQQMSGQQQTPTSQAAAAGQRSSSPAAAGPGSLRPQAVRPAGGFNLKSVVAAVAADSQQQQQQEDELRDWVQQQPQQQQQHSGLPAAAAAATGGASEDFEADDDADCLNIVLHSSSNSPGVAAAAAGHSGRAAAVAAPQAAASMVSSRHTAGGSSSSRAIGSSGGGSSGQGSEANKRMRTDLGLGPKPQAQVSKSVVGSGAGSKAPKPQLKSKQPHVSRIGAVGAGVKTVGAGVGADAAPGRAPAAGVAAARAAAGGSSGAASGFRATFERVLQRADINKPDAKLLSAASDQKHAAMFSKLLDQYEQKDQLAQQLEGITKLQVTAFECRTCNALSEKRRASCMAHDVVSVRVTKRWWLCEACGWKVHTLREVMPSKRCPKCRDPGVLFKSTSAYSAPKPQLLNSDAAANPMASREGMMARGREHAFCLQNSL